MSLFKRKPPDDGDNGGEWEPQPKKAAKWFEHARTAADSSNFEYALQCYAVGLKLDPISEGAHDRMWEAAVRYMNQKDAKPASSKEVKSLEDGTPVGKYAAAFFTWMKDLKNVKAAMKAMDLARKADLEELGPWMAPKVFGLVRSQKKVTKSMLVQAMELFRDAGAWDESLSAGEMARQLDPSDGDLAAEVKNLSAQRAMDQGGYAEAAGEEGGFRKFIKDADKQQELIEDESLAGSATTADRLLARAEAGYAEEPDSPDALNTLALLLRKRGTAESEARAIEIYEKGFAATSEYRFKMAAMDIRLEQMHRKVKALEAKAAETPADEGLGEKAKAGRAELLAALAAEHEERVAHYPTDRLRKFQLGEIQFQLGRYDDAMAQFQSAKDEPKVRMRSADMLGLCFFEEGWYAEAISEFEEALSAGDVAERDREMDIRYDLLIALLASANQEEDVETAKKARLICSDIARKDITFRDIRVKRKEVDELIKKLTG